MNFFKKHWPELILIIAALLYWYSLQRIGFFSHTQQQIFNPRPQSFNGSAWQPDVKNKALSPALPTPPPLAEKKCYKFSTETVCP